VTVGSENTVIPVFKTPAEMQEWSNERRSSGLTIGCVPTMGSLHEGHLSLVRASASECDETILTIFVNPTQFGPTEDFSNYPRQEEKDLLLAKEAGATVAFCPGVHDMYMHDSSVYVIEEKLTNVLCGASRPVHFTGVATIVAKLLNSCLPDKAYFGQKDYQQLLVIKRMVRDLNFPLEIISCPIVREPDGLAMSSRNRYLSETERSDALCLSVSIDAAVSEFENGERDPRKIESAARKIIETIPSAKIDYIECRDACDLSEIDSIDKPAVLALAVFIGNTRLIDNEVLTPEKEVL